jgi:FKBP-type peptidyl-prolyl cis-trans isomerase (trigger factor)
VNLFLESLEKKQLGELEDTMFRELGVVFEVECLKKSCRDRLKSKMDTANCSSSRNLCISSISGKKNVW